MVFCDAEGSWTSDRLEEICLPLGSSWHKYQRSLLFIRDMLAALKKHQNLTTQDEKGLENHIFIYIYI